LAIEIHSHSRQPHGRTPPAAAHKYHWPMADAADETATTDNMISSLPSSFDDENNRPSKEASQGLTDDGHT
jgi:hypothetical protein